MTDCPAYQYLATIMRTLATTNGCDVNDTKTHIRIFSVESTSWHVSLCVLLASFNHCTVQCSPNLVQHQYNAFIVTMHCIVSAACYGGGSVLLS